jgi:prolycopene isomerase
VPTFSRSVFPGLDIELPMHREGFEQAICTAVPSARSGVRRFLDRVMAIAAEADGLSATFAQPKAMRIRRLLTIPLRLRAMPRYLFATLEQVLDHDVQEPRARALLCQAWSYVGLPPSRCSFVFYAAALGSMLRHACGYPATRSQGLSNAFAECLRRHGGELRLACGARRITLSNGRATGVVTETGERLSARAIVSNAGPVPTLTDLVGVEHLPTGALETLCGHRVGTSIFQVYLGVAKPIEELGLRSHEVMLNEDDDVEAHHRRGYTFERPGHMLIGCPNVAIPRISPAGTSTVTLTAMVHGDPWIALSPEAYFDHKHRVAESMLGWANEIAPGLRDAVEVVEVGTPLTMMRYAGHLGGAIYGFENSAISHTLLRPPPVSPVAGLFYVGAWTNPGGGYWPALSSGQMVGEILASKLRGEER